MIPHYVYYQLAMVGCLCIIFHYIWPSRATVRPQLPSASVFIERLNLDMR